MFVVLLSRPSVISTPLLCTAAPTDLERIRSSRRHASLGACLILEADDACPKPPINCKCTKTNDVCRASFSQICGFLSNALYECPDGAGPEPVVKEACTEGSCVIQSGHDDSRCRRCLCKSAETDLIDKCNSGDKCLERSGNDICPSPCFCKDYNTICGSNIPVECASKLNATIEENAFCDYDEDLPLCSNKFHKACRLKNKGVYKCKENVPVEVDMCGKTDICLPIDEDDPLSASQCLDQCLCRGKRITCASKYSPKCGYDSNYVYDCSGFGEDLKVKEKCTTTCYTYLKGGGCTGDPCVCWKKGGTCGYTFLLDCNLLNHTLYQCEAAVKPPKYVGNDCLGDQICTTYSQENDVCATTNTCTSTTKDPTCSQEFQP
ncbi:hypothetical protein BGZ96_009631 [Linnemannia gamsii]|uniref:Uncharacterized protein n=1 Tax=Linnemannia gamsii TaxID=64522 RepID=A0ABQ7JW35_9FUNG|nr:hypothetical protein BGZ96_009631 [Linnemannia gamsii]